MARLRVDTVAGAGQPGGAWKDRTDLEVRSQTAMLNIIWELRERGKFRPYVLGGVGWYHNKVRGTQTTQSPLDAGPFVFSTSWNEGRYSDVAWSAGVGGSLELGDRLHLEVCYRWVDLGKYVTGPDVVSGNESYTANLRSSEALVGVRVRL
ncbi:MAG: outer membrane beta-barrel protein [Candidatus Riflebacteria bacterium]|nr:outer membrane beta-barrel protein [Candidatus Riflebacteria bacterium]